MTTYDQIKKNIQTCSKTDKIKLLESLYDSSEQSILELIISEFDNPDIEIRGEAFSSLLLNENDISDILLQSLQNQSKNIRGYCALVLANRNERKAIAEIIHLTDDESSMVRSCAVGALGYLRATNAHLAIQKCINDPNIEVKKSAIKSSIDIGDKNLLTRLDELAKENDPEINSLLVLAQNRLSGPGGI